MQFTVSLKANRDFQRLYRRGKCAVRPCLVLYTRKTGSGRNRLGITVTGKVGKAHTRNKVRRRLREIYRLHEMLFDKGIDLVVVARSRAAGEPYARLEAEFLSAGRELGAVT